MWIYRTTATSDGPVFQQSEIKRPATGLDGKVLGRDIVEAGRKYGVSRDAVSEVEESELGTTAEGLFACPCGTHG